MTKRFLVISSIALAIIIATVTTIIVICVNNRDTYTEDDGTFVATPATTERLYEILEENDSQRLKIDFSKIDVYSDVAISDKTNREVLILNGGGLYFEEFSIVTNAKNLVIGSKWASGKRIGQGLCARIREEVSLNGYLVDNASLYG